MHADHHSPLGIILLSMVSGLATWLSDPNVWRAVAVAALCGFVGGVCKAAGLWFWHRTKKSKE